MKTSVLWNDILTKGAILGGVMLASNIAETSMLIYGGTIGWMGAMSIECLAVMALYCYLIYRFDITCITEHMHRHDTYRMARNFLFNFIRINAVERIRFHKHRGCAVHGDTHHTGNIGIALDDHFISGAEDIVDRGRKVGTWCE